MSKAQVAKVLLNEGSIFIHLDPRAEGVEVPNWLKRQPQLVLQVGYNMPVPIYDLSIDDQQVSATLSFSRTGFFCKVPWSSVFCLVGDNEKGMFWPESMPPEIAKEVEAERAASKSTKSKPDTLPKSKPTKVPYLRVIK